MAYNSDDYAIYKNYVDQVVTKALNAGLGQNGIMDARVLLKYSDASLLAGSTRFDRGNLSTTIRAYISPPATYAAGEIWLDLRKSSQNYRRFVLNITGIPNPQQLYVISTITDLFDPLPLMQSVSAIATSGTPPAYPVLVYTNTETPSSWTIFSENSDLSAPNSSLAAVQYSLYVTPSGNIFGYSAIPTPRYFPLRSYSQDFTIATPGNTFSLPLATAQTSRFVVRINGILYDSTFYTVSGTTLTWTGPFPIDPTDQVIVTFY